MKFRIDFFFYRPDTVTHRYSTNHNCTNSDIARMGHGPQNCVPNGTDFQFSQKNCCHFHGKIALLFQIELYTHTSLLFMIYNTIVTVYNTYTAGGRCQLSFTHEHDESNEFWPRAIKHYHNTMRTTIHTVHDLGLIQIQLTDYIRLIIKLSVIKLF